MITITTIPPEIKQTYNRYILDPLYEMKTYVEDVIVPRSKKKIRTQDVGKRREFEKLIIEYMDEYERKKIEEENYKRENQEFAKKMPCLPATGNTMRFKRI